MAVNLCPRCRQRYVVDIGINDFIHSCNSGIDALDKEQKLVIGAWEDYTGSGGKSSQEVMMQGAENKLFGTTADIEGEDLDELRRGKRRNLFRERQHLEFVEIKK
jgi:hypothetical protein